MAPGTVRKFTFRCRLTNGKIRGGWWKMELRVLLVDDHVLFRKGVAAILRELGGIDVVGEAGDGQEAVLLATEKRPEIILMDINMPVLDGLEATRRIKALSPAPKVVVLTYLEDEENLFAALKSGADGYLLKDVRPEQLKAYLQGVAQGEAAISGGLAIRVLKEFAGVRPGKEASERDDLTPREREVLELLAEGLRRKEIASKLFISENTVKVHLRNIMEKLHVRNRVELGAYIAREGEAFNGVKVDARS